LLYKGHQQLIDAWPKVVDNCPNAQLWIAGDGDGRYQIEEKVRALPRLSSNQIIFWGRVSDEKLVQLYKTCRVFAMPSTGEGFGLVFVEAARYGLPCIGGKYDSVKEIILDGETGFLVEQTPNDIADACLKLLTDDRLAKWLGEANQQRVFENFQYDHFQERLFNALEL
jgi:phosphatidylinositol alpha-1,6-mannosyltransferase